MLVLGALAVYSGVPGVSRGSNGGLPASVTGFAHVIDGDTIDVQGYRVRFDGIDAPERDQTCRHGQAAEPCGRQSGNFLAGLIGSGSVTCEVRGEDQYGRLLGICSQGETNLNRTMVSEGQAVAYTRYSKRYLPQELSARWYERGIWATEFIRPETWRHRN